MDKGNSLAANAACAIQRLRILPFTTGSALLQLQTDPHDRWKMECAFKLCTIHLPRSGGATSPGADAKDRYAITRLVGLAGSIKSRHRGFCFSAPISPPLWFSAQTEKIAFNAVGFRHVRREPRRTRQSSVLLHLLPDCQNILRILYPS